MDDGHSPDHEEAAFSRYVYTSPKPLANCNIWTGNFCEACAKRMKDEEDTELEARKRGDLQE